MQHTAKILLGVAVGFALNHEMKTKLMLLTGVWLLTLANAFLAGCSRANPSGEEGRYRMFVMDKEWSITEKDKDGFDHEKYGGQIVYKIDTATGRVWCNGMPAGGMPKWYEIEDGGP